MAIRYQQQKPVQKYLEKIWKTIIQCFRNNDELELFVKEHVNVEVSYGINWDQPLRDSSYDLLTTSLREGYFDTLIGGLQEARPDNADLNALITCMVQDGQLSIVQA